MRLPTPNKELLPSQAYLWACLRAHTGFEVKLRVRRWVRGKNVQIGYYLHTPLGDFGRYTNLNPISPFHLPMWYKGRLPSQKKVQTATYRMIFDHITLSQIARSAIHLKDISFELEGLQEMFGMNEHMRRIGVSMLGMHTGSSRAYVGRFILTPEQASGYTELWETERDARLVAKGKEAAKRVRSRKRSQVLEPAT